MSWNTKSPRVLRIKETRFSSEEEFDLFVSPNNFTAQFRKKFKGKLSKVDWHLKQVVF